MRIAVASKGLEVAPSFVQCTSFMCYQIDRGRIVSCQNMPNLLLPTSRLTAIFKELGITTVIVGSAEQSAAKVLAHAGIDLVQGASGSANQAARAYLTHTLAGHEDELDALEA